MQSQQRSHHASFGLGLQDKFISPEIKSSSDLIVLKMYPKLEKSHCRSYRLSHRKGEEIKFLGQCEGSKPRWLYK